MSGEPKGFSLTPVDPEKGTLDPLPLQLPWSNDLNPSLSATDIPPGLSATKEKDAAVTTTKEVIVAETSKPPANPKVSKWILWTLWFNTYRYPLSSHLSCPYRLVS